MRGRKVSLRLLRETPHLVQIPAKRHTAGFANSPQHPKLLTTSIVAIDLPRGATSSWPTATKIKDQGNETATQAHPCSDEVHDIDCSDGRDAGPAEHAEKIEEPERAENEGNPQGSTFVAHERASLVVAVQVLTGPAELANRIICYRKAKSSCAPFQSPVAQLRFRPTRAKHQIGLGRRQPLATACDGNPLHPSDLRRLAQFDV